MKKIFLALVAAMTMTAAMAQGDNQQRRGNRNMPDRTEMIKQRTDNAVKKYGLDDGQAAKLLSLNTKYADKIGPGMGGMRGGRGMGQRPGFGQVGGQGQMGQRPEMTEEMREQMEKRRQEREKAQKEYDTELQQILTPDQFKAYQADQEEMRKNFGRRGGPRGNRQQ